MRTFVDGYNVLWALATLRKRMLAGQPDEARKGLVALLGGLRRSGRLRGETTVVFDGRTSAAVAGQALPEGVTVRFAQGPQGADRRITEMLEEAPPGEDMTVVTSDRELQARSRRLGARVLGVHRFMKDYLPEEAGRASGRRRKRGQARPEDRSPLEKPPAGLPDFEVDRWLREFGLDE